MYIMKKNNVERSVDTEAARQNLEEIGYEVLKTNLETADEIQKEENGVTEPKSEEESERLEAIDIEEMKPETADEPEKDEIKTAEPKVKKVRKKSE